MSFIISTLSNSVAGVPFVKSQCFLRLRPRLIVTKMIDRKQKDGHIYVIKEREFLKTNENIYKIGRSKSIINRMPAYPKNSRIYSILYVKDVNEVEKFMIDRFDKLFVKRVDIGNEYYECSEEELMKECTMIIHALYM